MTVKQLSQEYVGYTISEGTLRIEEDLIPAAIQFLSNRDYVEALKFKEEFEDNKRIDAESEVFGWLWDEICDFLDVIAPDGCYFGSHPGDGACFGFWTVEEDGYLEAFAGYDVDDEDDIVISDKDFLDNAPQNWLETYGDGESSTQVNSCFEHFSSVAKITVYSLSTGLIQ